MTARLSDAGWLVCERCESSRRFNLVEVRGEQQHLCRRCERAVATEAVVLDELDLIGGVGRTVQEVAWATLLSPAQVRRTLRELEARGGIVLRDEFRYHERGRPVCIWRKHGLGATEEEEAQSSGSHREKR